MSGKQIKLFLADGTPGGVTTAEITSCTGHVLSTRRSDLADLLKRDEAQRAGAYLLLGDDEAAIENTRCYIGEADVVAERLRYQQRDKEFWDRVVVITSKDANLTKAHGRNLEPKLISLAALAGRVTVENSTAPGVPALPEADASDMDYFVSQLQIVLPVLVVNAIRVPTPSVPNKAADTTGSPIFHLRQVRLGVDARAQQIDGEFTMLAGSTVVPSWHGVGKADSTKKAYDTYRAQHQQLIDTGAIAVVDGNGRLTRNVVFSSPSTAGAVALGRSYNGRREWGSAERPSSSTFARRSRALSSHFTSRRRAPKHVAAQRGVGSVPRRPSADTGMHRACRCVQITDLDLREHPSQQLKSGVVWCQSCWCG